MENLNEAISKTELALGLMPTATQTNSICYTIYPITSFADMSRWGITPT
jgi:hypothetical protein